MISERAGEDRIAFARANWTLPLQTTIQIAFAPNIEWDLPPGAPPFEQNQYLDQEANLYKELRRLYVFWKVEGDKITSRRKQELFVSLLDHLNKDDVATVLAIKEKTLPFGLTKEDIDTVYPGMLELKDKTTADTLPVAEPVDPQTETSEEVRRGRGRPPKSK